VDRDVVAGSSWLSGTPGNKRKAAARATAQACHAHAHAHAGACTCTMHGMGRDGMRTCDARWSCSRAEPSAPTPRRLHANQTHTHRYRPLPLARTRAHARTHARTGRAVRNLPLTRKLPVKLRVEANSDVTGHWHRGRQRSLPWQARLGPAAAAHSGQPGHTAPGPAWRPGPAVARAARPTSGRP
jgi:hypothetical protein